MTERFVRVLNSVLHDPNGVKMPDPITQNYDSVLYHVNSLLESVIILCQQGHFTQALFLGITAVEEATKAEIYCFRNKNNFIGRQSKDCLKSHEVKHRVAVNEDVLLIGRRVQNIIGEDLTKNIYENFGKGKTRELRESCLYFDVKDEKLILSEEDITPQTALSYIFTCIEIIDDKMVGWTNYSMELSPIWDEYFNIVKEIYENISTYDSNANK